VHDHSHEADAMIANADVSSLVGFW